MNCLLNAQKRLAITYSNTLHSATVIEVSFGKRKDSNSKSDHE
jgi:hypothetical protein